MSKFLGLGFLGPDPEPWAFRGGLSGEFQVLIVYLTHVLF